MGSTKKKDEMEMDDYKPILFIVIPAYNEEENISRCIEDWYPVVEKHHGDEKSRLVIVDDGSKDKTAELLEHLKKTRPLLTCLTKSNGGHGSAILYGYNYALKNGAEWIFQTDSDGQTNSAEFEQFWDNIKYYDAVLGKRIIRGDGFVRKIIEDVVCLLLCLIFRIKVRDANAPFRLMKAELVERYIKKLPSDYSLPNIMLTTYFMYYKENVLYLPISFKPRIKGKNSIKLGKIFLIGWKAVGDFLEFRKDMNSL